MKITLIAGTHRPAGESARVGRYLEARLKEISPGIETYFLHMAEVDLPFWDEGRWGKESNVDWAKVWGPISAELKSSDGVIVISPEYAGMVPARLKNLFLHVDKGELSHKPGMIVGVSASRGGSYPVAELRTSSYKNTQLTWTPEHLIVRDAAKMLHGDAPANDDDGYIRKRADYALKILLEYAKALKSVRDSGVVDGKTYPFGM
ncbi:MAG: NAD(P)H-dependent oxidoreductase [Bdellovibrionales bacterium]